MALRSLAALLLVVMIIPKIFVMANLVAKPREMIVNIVYDFVEDGNGTHNENPTGAPTGTDRPGTSVTMPPATPSTSKQTMSPVTVPATSSTTDNGEFHCTSEGIFADPKDCKSYYRCSKDLVATHDRCMFGFGHFDPTTQGCAIGGC